MITKYRYIIWDSFDGVFKGTNNPDHADQFARIEDYSVYDTQSGKRLYYVIPEDENPMYLVEETTDEIHNPFDN